MNLKNTVTSILLISICLICLNQTTSAQTQYNAKLLQELSQFPSWFTKELDNEKKIKKKSKLKVDKYNIDSKILGTVKSVEEQDGVLVYSLDIGTTSPVECFVYEEFDGPTNSLYSVTEFALGAYAQVNEKKLTNKFNFAIGSGVINDAPYIIYDTFYILGSKSDKLLGLAKAISVLDNELLHVCLHNQIGYRQTFFKAVSSVVNAFSDAHEKNEFHKSVNLLTVNDIPVGFIQETFSKDQDGDIKVNSDFSLIVPVDNNNAARSDLTLRSWSRADGSLINATEISVNNNELGYALSLASTDNKWRVEGQFQGKSIDTTLAHDKWISSQYGYYIDSLKLLNSNETSINTINWSPSTDPTSITNGIISKINDDSNANFKFNMGPLEMKYKAKNNGLIEYGSIEQGPIEMFLKSIYSKGDPVLK